MVLICITTIMNTLKVKSKFPSPCGDYGSYQ